MATNYGVGLIGEVDIKVDDPLDLVPDFDLEPMRKKVWANAAIMAYRQASFFSFYSKPSRSTTQARWDARKEKRVLRDAIKTPASKPKDARL